ncbi:flagellar type III secretion system protein FlhB [Paracoccus sp. Z118]|uniref:flagellar type III secretion system protein FlhB n=1 Tax=Paracoccus sp. Z118 TaxID=2851017 RepID=UPI001C2C4C6E|nr:flagellar type III secretion system protein FlhB [Paracoccus sp. Z118]MBV0890754.1 flagellar type III secretion system protein FlhB [Paracoccus sp. Z118]
MSEDKEDRQHDPSEQKLRRAREKGDIPRSPETSTALSWLGSVLALTMVAAAALGGWSAMAARLLGAEAWPVAPASAFDIATALGRRSGVIVLALLTAPAALVLLGLVVQRGFVFTPSKLSPDLNRINPLKNAGQKFGRQGLMTFALSLAKAALVAAGGWLLFRSLMGRLGSAAFLAEDQWTAALALLMRQVLLLALAIAVVFAGIDLFWKRLEFLRRNRMTRKEVQDEHKESEGDPHLKQARRQRAVDIALGTMLADVEKADVVIVNPTHYAVALEWKRGSGRAPVCLAKGVDEVAARICERARAHDVPIWSDPPCARALHATVKLGEEIPHAQFGPVAAAIRFAEAMRVRARQGWGAGQGGGAA